MWVVVMAAALAMAAAKVPPQVPLPSSCNPLVCACAEDLGAANCTGKVSIHQFEDSLKIERYPFSSLANSQSQYVTLYMHQGFNLQQFENVTYHFRVS